LPEYGSKGTAPAASRTASALICLASGTIGSTGKAHFLPKPFELKIMNRR
jgi:hypothetical protein